MPYETMLAIVVFAVMLAVALAGLLVASRNAEQLHRHRADQPATPHEPTLY